MKSKKLSESILRSIKSKGFKYIDLPPVIEANHIVERSGETFKRFLFSFNDQKGQELCCFLHCHILCLKLSQMWALWPLDTAQVQDKQKHSKGGVSQMSQSESKNSVMSPLLTRRLHGSLPKAPHQVRY